LKAIYTALLILTIEPLLLAINALPKSLLIPTETRILRWFGYIQEDYSRYAHIWAYLGKNYLTYALFRRKQITATAVKARIKQ
ncbi:hypothetical protein L1264_21345, partial [Pseudoalteromonas sp. APAL1]